MGTPKRALLNFSRCRLSHDYKFLGIHHEEGWEKLLARTPPPHYRHKTNIRYALSIEYDKFDLISPHLRDNQL